MKDLKALIEEATGENGLDIEKLTKTINSDYVDPILAKKLETKQEEFTNNARESIEKEIFSSVHETVTNKDTFDVYSKKLLGNMDETKQLLLKSNTLNGELENSLKAANSEVNKYKQNLILNSGITKDETYAKFLVNEYNTKVTDETDFMSVVNSNKPQEETPPLKAGIHQREKDTPITIEDSEKAKWRKLAGL